jgi:hypothetical protein
MVNNSTNITKTNNHLWPQTTNHKKDHDIRHWKSRSLFRHWKSNVLFFVFICIDVGDSIIKKGRIGFPLTGLIQPQFGDVLNKDLDFQCLNKDLDFQCLMSWSFLWLSQGYSYVIFTCPIINLFSIEFELKILIVHYE